MKPNKIILLTASACALVLAAGCTLNGPLPDVQQEAEKPVITGPEPAEISSAEQNIPTSEDQKPGENPEHDLEPEKDSDKTPAVTDPVTLKADQKSLLALAPKVVSSYRSISYDDDTYKGYRDLEFYSTGLQKSLIDNAARTKQIIDGRSMIIEPYDVNVKPEDVQIDGEIAVVIVHYKERGTDTSQEFDREMTGRLSFEKKKDSWLVTDVYFDIDHSD